MAQFDPDLRVARLKFNVILGMKYWVNTSALTFYSDSSVKILLPKTVDLPRILHLGC